MRVYLDNAASTPLDKEVLEAMMPYMLEVHGNPSSIHTHGRESRSAIEKARKKVADLLNTSPSEIFFTSGGTEADNTAIRCSIESYGLTHAITSPTEHHAVLHTLEHLKRQGIISLSYVKLDDKGNVDPRDLQNLLEQNPRSFVSLMHGNNEIGNLLNLEDTGGLCESFGAVFHSDTVQTVAHYKHDLSRLKVKHIAGSAHKFHGPKGVGFLYINAAHKIHPFVHGGAQERNMRGGTENVPGIIGLAKALEIGYRDMDKDREYISGLKQYLIEKLHERIPDVQFNGESASSEKSLYTVLSASLPPSGDNDMLLFSLDIQKISVSGGSACSSGTSIGSHVLEAIGSDPDRGAIRFSFSKYNTRDEIDYTVGKLAELLSV